MDFDEYQKLARTTRIYLDKYKIIYPALKLAGEAGEVSEKVGKVLRDNNGEFSETIKHEISKELGDVLWYISAMADDIGIELNAIALENINKLNDRKNRNVIAGSGDNR